MINHPKLFVLSSIAGAMLTECGLKITASRPEEYLHDMLADGPVWPVYPEIAARLGLDGSYQFKVPKGLQQSSRPAEILDLKQFVERSFACYTLAPKSDIKIPRLAEQAELYRDLESLVTKSRRKRENPYSNLPDYCFWQRSVANVAASDLDPVVTPKLQIVRSDRIPTAKSCFAQHIAKTLIKADYSYFVSEPAPADMAAEAAAARGYGLFSAHYLRSEAQSADSGDRHAAVLKQEIAQVARIICDEELLDGSRKDTGLAARNAPSVKKDASAGRRASCDVGGRNSGIASAAGGFAECAVAGNGCA